MDKKLNLEELKKEPIIVFPFGPDGKAAADTLINHGYNVVAFWDNYKFGREYNGIPVKKPSIEDNSSVILICARFSIEKTLLNQCKDLMCANVHLGSDLICQLNLSYKERNQNLNIIEQKKYTCEVEKLKTKNKDLLISKGFVLSITEKCSLKCKDCIMLMPYFESPKDSDVESTIKQIDNLANSIDYIYKIGIVGGEPFICKELYKYIEKLKKINNIGLIGVGTNGTIIPKGKNLECLKDEKVYVEISDYGNLSKNIDDLEKLFQNEEIQYRRLDRSGWTKCTVFKHNRTAEQLKEVYKNCTMHISCYTIKDGKIFPCPFLSTASKLKAIPNDISCYSVDLAKLSRDELRQKIKQFYKSEFFEACDYCNGFYGDVTQVPAAEQVDKPIPYKKYE